jgi:hypothetical protein
MTIRLRAGWAAKSRDPGHNKGLIEAAEAPANFMNSRRVSRVFSTLADDRFFVFDIIVPFRLADPYAALFYPTQD